MRPSTSSTPATPATQRAREDLGLGHFVGLVRTVLGVTVGLGLATILAILDSSSILRPSIDRLVQNLGAAGAVSWALVALILARFYENLGSIRATGERGGPVSAVVGMLLPIVNVATAFRIARELEASSDPWIDLEDPQSWRAAQLGINGAVWALTNAALVGVLLWSVPVVLFEEEQPAALLATFLSLTAWAAASWHFLGWIAQRQVRRRAGLIAGGYAGSPSRGRSVDLEPRYALVVLGFAVLAWFAVEFVSASFTGVWAPAISMSSVQIALLASGLAVAYLQQMPWQKLVDIGETGPRSLAGAALIGLGYPLVSLNILPRFVPVAKTALAPTAELGLLLGLWAAVVIVVAPVVEELIFRGLLFGALSRALPQLGVVFVTTVLFAAAHGNTVQATNTLVLGLFLALARVGSGGVVVGILLHFLNNLIVSSAAAPLVMSWGGPAIGAGLAAVAGGSWLLLEPRFAERLRAGLGRGARFGRTTRNLMARVHWWSLSFHLAVLIAAWRGIVSIMTTSTPATAVWLFIGAVWHAALIAALLTGRRLRIAVFAFPLLFELLQPLPDRWNRDRPSIPARAATVILLLGAVAGLRGLRWGDQIWERDEDFADPSWVSDGLQAPQDTQETPAAQAPTTLEPREEPAATTLADAESSRPTPTLDATFEAPPAVAPPVPSAQAATAISGAREPIPQQAVAVQPAARIHSDLVIERIATAESNRTNAPARLRALAIDRDQLCPTKAGAEPVAIADLRAVAVRLSPLGLDLLCAVRGQERPWLVSAEAVELAADSGAGGANPLGNNQSERLRGFVAKLREHAPKLVTDLETAAFLGGAAATEETNLTPLATGLARHTGEAEQQTSPKMVVTRVVAGDFTGRTLLAAADLARDRRPPGGIAGWLGCFVVVNLLAVIGVILKPQTHFGGWPEAWVFSSPSGRLVLLFDLLASLAHFGVLAVGMWVILRRRIWASRFWQVALAALAAAAALRLLLLDALKGTGAPTDLLKVERLGAAVTALSLLVWFAYWKRSKRVAATFVADPPAWRPDGFIAKFGPYVLLAIAGLGALFPPSAASPTDARRFLGPRYERLAQVLVPASLPPVYPAAAAWAARKRTIELPCELSAWDWSRLPMLVGLCRNEARVVSVKFPRSTKDSPQPPAAIETHQIDLAEPAFFASHRDVICVLNRLGQGRCGSPEQPGPFYQLIELPVPSAVTAAALVGSRSEILVAISDPPRVEHYTFQGDLIASYPTVGRVVQLAGRQHDFAARISQGPLRGVSLGRLNPQFSARLNFFSTPDPWITFEDWVVHTSRLRFDGVRAGQPRQSNRLEMAGLSFDKDSDAPWGLVVDLPRMGAASASERPRRVVLTELPPTPGSDIPTPSRIRFDTGAPHRLITVASSNRQMVVRDWYDRRASDLRPW